MTAVITTGTVDVEVHCEPNSLAELAPYFSQYWRTYLIDGGVNLAPAQGGMYPPAAPTSATAAARAAGVFPPRRVDQLPPLPETAVLSCVSSFQCNRNPYYEAALTGAVNEWLRAEWLEHDQRLRASMVVPTLDTEAAVAEIERIGDDPRIVQVLLPVRNDLRWGNKRYRPVLRAAAERGLVVGLHAWGRIANASTSTGFTHTYLEDYLSNSQVLAQAQLTSLVAEGVFTELPELRVAILECGFSWFAALLWRFDKDWKGVWREVPWLRDRPSVVARRHFRLSTAPAHLPRDPEQAREALDLLDAGSMLMYASDYPHDHGGGTDRLLAALTDPERERVLGDNARHWYRL